MAIEHADDANFSELIKSGLVLVDFWASWCGPCRIFGPIFESASNKRADVKFLKFEVNESNRSTPAKHGIRSIPTVLAFRDGGLVESRTGLMDEDTLNEWIDGLSKS